MTQKNELETDRHFNMSYVEFLECLARCADKFDRRFLTDHFPDFKAKNPYELDKKLECIIHQIMYSTISQKQYERQFVEYKALASLESELGKAMIFWIKT